MTILAALRYAERTVSSSEAEGEVTREEATAVVALARADGYSDVEIARAFGDAGYERLYRSIAPAFFVRPAAGAAERLLRARERLECSESFDAAARSARRVIDGFVTRWSVEPREYATLSAQARAAFWQSVLLTGARSPERLFGEWVTLDPAVVSLARADLEHARTTLRASDTRAPSAAEIDATLADLQRAERTATLALVDPAPAAPSADDLALYLRLVSEAAWDARVGSRDRGEVFAWATSPIVPPVFGGSPVSPRSPRRAVMETTARVAAWVTSDAASYSLLALNVLRGIALGAEAYDRTSPDGETRLRTYLRDAVRREADDDVARESEIFRRLSDTAERLEAIRQWRVAHPETVEPGPVLRRAP